MDIADCSRLMTLAAGKHLDRYITATELADISHGTRQVERLVGRLAQGSLPKALGVGWGNGVPFANDETVSKDSGAPAVMLATKI